MNYTATMTKMMPVRLNKYFQCYLIQPLGVVHTSRQIAQLVSVDEVSRLFTDKLGTDRWFCNFSKCEASLRKNFKKFTENVRVTSSNFSKIL